MDAMMVLLRVLHVGLGALWVGSIFFSAAFLQPAVASTAPAGGRVMQALNQRRFTETMLAFGLLTILTGLELYRRLSSNFAWDWIVSPVGFAFTLGGIATLVAYLVGLSYTRPAAKRLAVLSGEVAAGAGPPSDVQAAELARLQRRLRSGLRSVAGLLVFALLAMAVARYV
jgi:uncharacterized membrane protein